MATSSLLVLPLLAVVASADTVGDIYDEYLQHNSHTCGHVKGVYKNSSCCGSPDVALPFQARPRPHKGLFENNVCDGKKAQTVPALDNSDCVVNGVVAVMEQSGGNITVGFEGGMNVSTMPIQTTYLEAGLCPVNVHWHLGTEHYSVGEFDENGVGPELQGDETDDDQEGTSRRLATAPARLGFMCHLYDENDKRFTTDYDWNHCQGMHVGMTYEVHWPHSRGGACGTPWQYQTPFYDGVFCDITKATTPSTEASIGVQGQVFTIINDEDYYYPDLFRGMIKSGDFGKDITYYTGSTTGTTRNNQICSNYAPITWQVDRKCHLISASSFDKMCADMMQQYDDMHSDTHAHGSRELVDSDYQADNLVFSV